MLNIFKQNSSCDEIEHVYQILENIERFIDKDTNRIDHPSCTIKNIKLKRIYEKALGIAQKLEDKNNSTLGVNGELLLLIEKISDGFFNDRVYLTTDDPYLKYFAKSLNEAAQKLHDNFTDILFILKEYENGIYLQTIENENFRDGELKEFLNGIKSLKNSITNILKNNYLYGYKLKNTSNDLNDKMHSILNASDKQAKILDEISFNISNIKEKAQSTTDDTKMMQKSSSEIKSSANKSLNYANETVTAMNDINTATEAISEAIEVIDQIAFQTNILSLNAAVEAATAGEAGKGFAVVASEVRNLASRSADAAKSIKELVSKATQKANEGKDISDNMIEGYTKLISNIDSIKELIDKTSIASKEQLENIVKVDKTLNYLQEETKNYVKIAHQTNEVGQNLHEISNKILEITNKTEFEGKNEIYKQEGHKEKEPELV